MIAYASVDFIVPGAPERRTTCPRGMPPPRTSSRPSISVVTRSISSCIARSPPCFPLRLPQALLDPVDRLVDPQEDEPHVRIVAHEREDEGLLPRARRDDAPVLAVHDHLEEPPAPELQGRHLARPRDGGGHGGHVHRVDLGGEVVVDYQAVASRDGHGEDVRE